LMRKKQDEFLRAVRTSSEVATSAVATKPSSPRLHPCDSPWGAVSPLTLGEAGDYFYTEVRLATMTPTMSPGSVSAKSLPMSAKETSNDGTKIVRLKKRPERRLIRPGFRCDVREPVLL
jgi:hypothetical protein